MKKYMFLLAFIALIMFSCPLALAEAAGDIVELPITVNYVPDGVHALEITFSFDSTALKFIDATIYSPNGYTLFAEPESDKYVLSIGNMNMNSALTEGIIATVSFEIKETAATGTYGITILDYKAVDEQSNEKTGLDITGGFASIEGGTVFVERVSILNRSFALQTGDSLKLSGATFPDNATDKTLVWSSSNPTVAEIDPDTGVVSARAPGIALITATARDGFEAKDTVKLGVMPAEFDVVLPLDMVSIEAEAFYNTSFEYIMCPNGLQSIDRLAFSECSSLRGICLPASVTSIADDAFSGSGNVLIYAPSNSEAAKFAASMGIPYAEY